MKKAVLFVCCLSFCSVDVFGMPPNSKEGKKSISLKEHKGGLVVNPFAEIDNPSAKSGNPHKRELSVSCEGGQENQKRRESKADGPITDSQKVAGFRKRVEKIEKENEDLNQKLGEVKKENEGLNQKLKEKEVCILVLEQKKEEQNKEIEEQGGQILSLERRNADLSQNIKEKELMVRTVNEYLDSSMEKCERQTIIDQISAEIWRRCGMNVVEKMKILIPAIISKVLELKMENIKNKEEIRTLQSELQKNNDESKEGMKKLQEQINQLNQIVQNRGNRVDQNTMDIDEGRNNVIRSESVNNFQEQQPLFNNRNVITYAFGSEVNRNVAQGIRADSEKQVRGNGKILANKRLGAEIKGCFVDGYLDFSMPIMFKGCYVKEQEFCFSGSEAERLDFISNSKKIRISEEDFFNMNETRAIQDLLSIFSSKTGRGFIFGKELVYQGAVDGDGNPSGLGIMLKSTGEMGIGCMSADEWLRM